MSRSAPARRSIAAAATIPSSGDYAILAGQVGIADHLTIGEGAVVGAKSGVTSNIPAGQRWLGFPALPGSEFLRAMIALRRQLRTEKKDDA
jgi:UDP-3-O-[3-hydroxymyristoyl] glucosamine N-acyltransferase